MFLGGTVLVSILVPEQIIIADAAFVGHEPVQFTVFLGWVDPSPTVAALPDHLYHGLDVGFDLFPLFGDDHHQHLLADDQAVFRAV